MYMVGYPRAEDIKKQNTKISGNRAYEIKVTVMKLCMKLGAKTSIFSFLFCCMRQGCYALNNTIKTYDEVHKHDLRILQTVCVDAGPLQLRCK